MTHNQYIANIQYKIDNLFYEYDKLEMYKYQNYDYYNEYTNFNHYDRLIMEAEEKKGIIRRIIDGIIKIIRTTIDKVKSFFSKNKKIDSNAEIKINSKLVGRVDNFKKKSSKLKKGFSILKGAVLGGAAGYAISKGINKGLDYLDKKDVERRIEKEMQLLNDQIRSVFGDATAEGDGKDIVKTIHVSILQSEIKNITKQLQSVNKDLETLLSKNPEDLGKSEKDFIQEINKLTTEGSKLIDEIISIINTSGNITSEKILDDYNYEKDKYNKLKGKVSNRVGNNQNNTKPTTGMTSIEGAQDIMMDMSISIGQIQAIIINDLKSAISRCDDQELNTLAKNCVFKCKKLADWCMRHAYITTDYTENDYDKQHTSCKNDYVAINSMEVSSDGSRVVNLVKKVNEYLNDVHNGAKQLHTMWEKNNK